MMAKVSKPQSEEEVFGVMKDYSEKKGFSFTDSKLRYLAENCYFYFESRGWEKIKYWPPLAMKWILNERGKFNKKAVSYKKLKPQGKSVRDKIMEQENNDK